MPEDIFRYLLHKACLRHLRECGRARARLAAWGAEGESAVSNPPGFDSGAGNYPDKILEGRQVVFNPDEGPPLMSAGVYRPAVKYR